MIRPAFCASDRRTAIICKRRPGRLRASNAVIYRSFIYSIRSVARCIMFDTSAPCVPCVHGHKSIARLNLDRTGVKNSHGSISRISLYWIRHLTHKLYSFFLAASDTMANLCVFYIVYYKSERLREFASAGSTNKNASTICRSDLTCRVNSVDISIIAMR